MAWNKFAYGLGIYIYYKERELTEVKNLPKLIEDGLRISTPKSLTIA